MAQAVPQSPDQLLQAAGHGEPLGRITVALLSLLDRYGTTELQFVIQEARQRGMPHLNAVRLALEHRCEAREVLPDTLSLYAKTCVMDESN